PTPVINPEPTQSTTFFLTVYDHLYDTLGNEITISNFPYYNACEPVVSQYFETLPTDATILTYPTYICETNPPIQLIPLNYGGTWSSPTCGSYPNGCITNGGFFFPNLALLGDNLITYEFSGVCADQQTVIINVVDAPVVSNIQEHCNATNTHFYVTFTVIGGNPGAYSFLNASDSSLAGGSIFGSTWTGPWLPSTSNYSYIVTDNNDCDPSIVTGYLNCQCTSDAGVMSTSQLELCAFDQVVVEVQTDAQNNPTYNLDGNDGFEYFLHDNQFSFLGNVINHNTTGIFLFQPPMVYGQTYYISHVVGNNIGTPTDHVVDITDNCLSVSQGTPVTWSEFPTSNAGLDDFICGNTIQLDADTAAIGIGTWSCMTATGTIYGPNFNDPKVTVTVPYFDTNQYGCLMNTDYTFRWTVVNGPCEMFDDVTITFKPVPVAFAGNDYTICGMDAVLQAEWSNLCGPIGSSVGEWFGPGAILQILSSVTDVTVFSAGTYTWIWRETNGECLDEDFVSITFIEQLVVDAGQNDTVYGNTYNLNAISTMGVGLWEGPPNCIFSDPTLPQCTAQIDFFGMSGVTAIFTWTEQNLFSSASDDVTIVFINTNSIITSGFNVSGFQLYQNVPNPFANETTISFYLPKDYEVDLEIFNLIGKRLIVLLSEKMTKGKHSITFNSKNLPAGIYYYRLKTEEFEETQKMVLMRK
ncbi:MAG: T9SS type A sorting domain-containing protein, partial [Bacteroidota bacterium]|nr:T9SS type A sorting domain-containing protein [Bacteroidota bacterium]